MSARNRQKVTVVMVNSPSDQALKNFMKKLNQLQKTTLMKEFTHLTQPVHETIISTRE